MTGTGGEKRVNYISVLGDAHSTPPACGAANTPALSSRQAQMQLGSDTVTGSCLGFVINPAMASNQSLSASPPASPLATGSIPVSCLVQAPTFSSDFGNSCVLGGGVSLFVSRRSAHCRVQGVLGQLCPEVAQAPTGLFEGRLPPLPPGLSCPWIAPLLLESL